jgi:hypothetical protein
MPMDTPEARANVAQGAAGQAITLVAASTGLARWQGRCRWLQARCSGAGSLLCSHIESGLLHLGVQ